MEDQEKATLEADTEPLEKDEAQRNLVDLERREVE